MSMVRELTKEIKDKIKKLIAGAPDMSNGICNRCGGWNGITMNDNGGIR